MSESTPGAFDASIVDDAMSFTLVELSRACRVQIAQISVLVDEGVLVPAGAVPAEWRFPGSSLARARRALRLARDFELEAPGVALALDLLDEIERLRARLRSAGLA